jgi:glycogen(starch) synthase
MKILMLGWELPPYNSGGLGIACYQLCKALSKKDIDIEFILPYRADHNLDFMKITAASAQDVKTFLLSGNAYDSDHFSLFNEHSGHLDMRDQQLLYQESVVRLAETNEYDIVHAHDWLTFSAALKLKQLKNWPVILHVHSVESDRAGARQGNPMVAEIENLALNSADRIIAVSELTKRAIIRDYAVPAENIEVVHNSMDISRIEPLDQDNAYKYLSLMKSLGYRVVVNVGRLTVQKGLPNLLEAAKKVIEKVPKTLFLFVGSGEQYYELINKAAELGIGNNVLFADFQRGKNWRDAFAIGDLFVMPSVSEPFGLTPLEAIGYGTPALVSKQSGISEVLNNCLKVDFWNIDEMANQIAAVMQNDELRDELWFNSYREFSRLSWDASSEKIINLYKDHTTGISA